MEWLLLQWWVMTIMIMLWMMHVFSEYLLNFPFISAVPQKPSQNRWIVLSLSTLTDVGYCELRTTEIMFLTLVFTHNFMWILVLSLLKNIIIIIIIIIMLTRINRLTPLARRLQVLNVFGSLKAEGLWIVIFPKM